jgi:hypothetical protein
MLKFKQGQKDKVLVLGKACKYLFRQDETFFFDFTIGKNLLFNIVLTFCIGAKKKKKTKVEIYFRGTRVRLTRKWIIRDCLRKKNCLGA